MFDFNSARDVPVKFASTVAFLREGSHGRAPFEVLVIWRNTKMKFAKGAVAFPGGRMDDADVKLAEGEPHKALRITALREAEEEVGLSIKHEGNWDTERLAFFSRWLTPLGEQRRYDTFFYFAKVDENATVTLNHDECSDHAWHTPQHILQLAKNGDIVLAPPTWSVLLELSTYPDIQTLVNTPKRDESKRVEPKVKPYMAPGDDGFQIIVPEHPLWQPHQSALSFPKVFVYKDSRFILAA